MFFFKNPNLILFNVVSAFENPEDLIDWFHIKCD